MQSTSVGRWKSSWVLGSRSGRHGCAGSTQRAWRRSDPSHAMEREDLLLNKDRLVRMGSLDAGVKEETGHPPARMDAASWPIGNGMAVQPTKVRAEGQ